MRGCRRQPASRPRSSLEAALFAQAPSKPFVKDEMHCLQRAVNDVQRSARVPPRPPSIDGYAGRAYLRFAL